MLDLILLFFLVVCALTAISMKDLLSTTIILGAYSLIMAVVWTRLNAVDVAFTEAAVGAGITSVLLLAALSRTQRVEDDTRQVPEERRESKRSFVKTEPGTQAKKSGISARSVLSLIIVIVTGAVLIYGTIDMPHFGDPDAPANTHVAKRYIEKSYEETGVVNFVTAILASYRGYDTLGEVAVIFTAGISVILLLRRRRR